VQTPAEEVVVGDGDESSRSVQRQWLRICDVMGWWLSRRRLWEVWMPGQRPWDGGRAEEHRGVLPRWASCAGGGDELRCGLGCFALVDRLQQLGIGELRAKALH
jgi:hypothetical protein